MELVQNYVAAWMEGENALSCFFLSTAFGIQILIELIKPYPPSHYNSMKEGTMKIFTEQTHKSVTQLGIIRPTSVPMRWWVKG